MSHEELKREQNRLLQKEYLRKHFISDFYLKIRQRYLFQSGVKVYLKVVQTLFKKKAKWVMTVHYDVNRTQINEIYIFAKFLNLC